MVQTRKIYILTAPVRQRQQKCSQQNFCNSFSGGNFSLIVREQDMMDQARQWRQLLLFEPNFIKNKNQLGRFLIGSYLPARFVWVDTIFSLFFVAFSRRFSFSIFGCLKQYISGISCGWILKDVFQHSNEPEK